MTVHSDGEFDSVQEAIAEMSSDPMVNLTSANMNVSKIERRIRLVKESFRANRHSLPFMRLPVILTINIVLNNINFLGYFPTTAEILKTISHRTIIDGETLNYKRHLAIPCGKYFQNMKKRPLKTAQYLAPRVLFVWVPLETSWMDSTL